MAMKEPAACEQCGENHESEAECPDPDVNSDEWDSALASAWTGSSENYSCLDDPEEA